MNNLKGSKPQLKKKCTFKLVQKRDIYRLEYNFQTLKSSFTIQQNELYDFKFYAGVALLLRNKQLFNIYKDTKDRTVQN